MNTTDTTTNNTTDLLQQGFTELRNALENHKCFLTNEKQRIDKDEEPKRYKAIEKRIEATEFIYTKATENGKNAFERFFESGN